MDWGVRTAGKITGKGRYIEGYPICEGCGSFGTTSLSGEAKPFVGRVATSGSYPTNRWRRQRIVRECLAHPELPFYGRFPGIAGILPAFGNGCASFGTITLSGEAKEVKPRSSGSSRWSQPDLRCGDAVPLPRNWSGLGVDLLEHARREGADYCAALVFVSCLNRCSKRSAPFGNGCSPASI